MTEVEQREYDNMVDMLGKVYGYRDALVKENAMLRGKLKEEDEYRQWVKDHRIRGYVCGYLSKCSLGYIMEHSQAELVEKTRTELRKMANNPLIAPEAKDTLEKARYMVEMYSLYMNKYYQLLDDNDKLRKIEIRKQAQRRKSVDGKQQDENQV